MRWLLTLALCAAPAGAERIKDIATFAGVRSNQLIGYGVVVGLNGTGDDNLEYSALAARNATQRLGLTLPLGVAPGLKNTAAVILTADLPAFSKPGQRIDVTVSAIGKAKSLRGGSLLLTPLQGADGAIYAMAQGSLVVGGFGVEGADGSKIVVNVPSTGRIPGGASVEREVESAFATSSALVLNLREPDFGTSEHVAEAINVRFGSDVAAPLDATSIRVSAPIGASTRVALISLIEAIEVKPVAAAARVVVNARTGTVVINGNVRISPAAVSHGNLTVKIGEQYRVSQPGPFGRGETVVTPSSDVAVREDKAKMFIFAPGAALDDIVKAVNRVGASPGDLVAILEALKLAGALRAELIIL